MIVLFSLRLKMCCNAKLCSYRPVTEHMLSALLSEDNPDKPANLMPEAVLMCVLHVLTQLVPVRQQDGGAVEYMRQRSLDQLPAGNALDGL